MVGKSDVTAKLSELLDKKRDYSDKEELIRTMAPAYLQTPGMNLASIMKHGDQLPASTWENLSNETWQRVAEIMPQLSVEERERLQTFLRSKDTLALGPKLGAATAAAILGTASATVMASPIAAASTPVSENANPASLASPRPADVVVGEDQEISLGLSELSERREKIAKEFKPRKPKEVETFSIDGKSVSIFCLLHYMSDRKIFKNKTKEINCDEHLQKYLDENKFNSKALLDKMTEGSDGTFAQDIKFYTDLYETTITLSHYTSEAARHFSTGGATPSERAGLLQTASNVQDWAYMATKILNKYMTLYSLASPQLAESNFVLMYVGYRMALIQLTHGRSNERLTQMEAELSTAVKRQIRILAGLNGLQGNKISLSSLPQEDSEEIKTASRLLAEIKKENERLTASVNDIQTDMKAIEKRVPSDVRERI